jgi:hypothetical protein
MNFEEMVKNMTDVELFENYKLECRWAKKEREIIAKLGSIATIIFTVICYMITQSFVFGGICFVILLLVIGTYQGNHSKMSIILHQEIIRRRYDKSRPL